MASEPTCRVKIALAHGLHLLLLVAPTALITGSVDGPLLLCVIGVVAAGYAESRSVVVRCDPNEAGDVMLVHRVHGQAAGVAPRPHSTYHARSATSRGNRPPRRQTTLRAS